jgi:hypothetical protein
MTNGREKGAVGERELADLLVSHGMMARRTVQYCGKTGEASDLKVDGLLVHVECKRVERIRLAEWVDQATNDARGRQWAIFTRQSRRPWLVIQTLDDWIRDSRAAEAAIEHRKSVLTRAAEEAWNVE